MTSLRLFLLHVVLLAVVVAGCNPTAQAEALPRLDDPKEILEEALRTTAELHFVHAKVDASMNGEGGQVFGTQSATLEGDLDLGQREFHAVLAATGGDATGQQVEMVLVGTDMFTRTQGGPLGNESDGRWQRMPIDAGSDPRNGIPATPAIAVALKALLDDPGITSTLEGMEACGDRQCYHLTVTIAPDVTWRAANGGLFGGQPGAEIGPPDPAIPEIALDVMVDEATRRLMSVSTTLAMQGVTADVAATLSDHDLEFDLLPPNPDDVADPNEGGGFSVPGAAPSTILEEVGSDVFEATPAPMQ
jgi:hypothetical protein